LETVLGDGAVKEGKKIVNRLVAINKPEQYTLSTITPPHFVSLTPIFPPIAPTKVKDNQVL
jgi:hypothetical protein